VEIKRNDVGLREKKKKKKGSRAKRNGWDSCLFLKEREHCTPLAIASCYSTRAIFASSAYASMF
jgi:hypothetical protein